ncbi:MAG: DUF3135 domain-containing protein [Deltaproteobacteria bacterium]|nr:DUF3135 domain-containing protein [Deltaproteobacteria bacterium]
MEPTTVSWESEKEKREQEALERHSRLAKLFREDRFSFERERRRMIEEVIESAEDDDRKARLRAFQEGWNRRMKNAGSRQNRFVLARAFFWEHFHGVWQPAIEELNRVLNRPGD